MNSEYRKNVGIVVFRKNMVLVFARSDQKDFAWQFPQGGIEKNENIIEAAKRELFEETGIKNIKPVATTPFTVKYDFPSYVLKNAKSKFRGQEQTWVLFEFLGNDSEINFSVNEQEIEFKAFEWVYPCEAVKRIVDFKKDAYSKVMNYFNDYMAE